MSLSVIYTTVASKEDAQTLAKWLVVDEKLAACVHILPGGESLYEWQGEIAVEPEFGMLIKTATAKVDAAVAYLSDKHPYDTPMILAWPVGAAPDYLKWVLAQVR